MGPGQGEHLHILAITPGEGLAPALWTRVMASGIDALMIREPGMDVRELLAAARWVRERAGGLGLWLNGRLDVALEAGCGLHAPEAHPPVPPGLLPVSRPLHDPARAAERLDAQQWLLSPVFPVPGKGPAWGPGRLREILDGLPAFPGRILALGGITPDNAASLRHPRLDGVALIRGLWRSSDPARAVARLRTAWTAGPP